MAAFCMSYLINQKMTSHRNRLTTKATKKTQSAQRNVWNHCSVQQVLKCLPVTKMASTGRCTEHGEVLSWLPFKYVHSASCDSVVFIVFPPRSHKTLGVLAISFILLLRFGRLQSCFFLSLTLLQDLLRF